MRGPLAAVFLAVQWTEKNDAREHYNNLPKRLGHENDRSHDGKPGDGRCRKTGCEFVTKRGGDLERQSSSIHGNKRRNFECPVLNSALIY